MVPRGAPSIRHPASRVFAARDPQHHLLPCLSTAPDSHARMAEGMRRNPLSDRSVSVPECHVGKSPTRDQAEPTIASASISNRHRGSIRAATTTIVLAGRIEPNTSPWTRETASASFASAK